MTEPVPETLLKRLERVERESRRWKIMAGTSLLVTGLLFVLGATSQKVPDEVRARRFVLEDQNGKVRAMLHIPGLGLAGLQIFDGDGKTGAFLNTWPEGGAALTRLDRALMERVNLSVSESGSAALHLRSLDTGRTVYWKAP